MHNTLKKDYTDLVPETILAAIDKLGFQTSGRILALNSYENRVYRCELDNGKPVVVKFYRPGRWTNQAIAEEHQFAMQLVEQEVPVVAPVAVDGTTLFEHEGYRYAIYPMRGGRWPDLESREDLNWMGRFIARIHNAGRSSPFKHRQQIEIDRMGKASSASLLEQGFIPDYLEQAYQTLIADLLTEIQAAFDRCGYYEMIKLHGDCHRGNVLWTDDGPHFVDLDDCCNGPAIQDQIGRASCRERV